MAIGKKKSLPLLDKMTQQILYFWVLKILIFQKPTATQ